MGIRNSFISLEDKFEEAANTKIIVNDLHRAGNFSNDQILNHILTVHESDIISTVPRCQCGDGKGLAGVYHLGEICGRCGSEVVEPDEYTGGLWLSSLQVPEPVVSIFPSKATYIPFLSPGFWILLSRLLSGNGKDKIDYLLWLCDDKMVVPEKQQKDKYKQIELLAEKVLNGNRSYVNVINNIENILEYLLQTKAFYKKQSTKTSDGDLRKEIYTVLDIYRTEMARGGRNIYTDKLPIINKYIFIMEKKPRGDFTSLNAAINVNVVKNWLNLCRKVSEKETMGQAPFDHIYIGRETARVIAELCKLYRSYLREYWYSKSGILRKHIGGTRTPFTWRGVIRSISGQHHRHGVEVPWRVAVPLFYPHLCNKLMKLGYSMRSINKILTTAVGTYDPLIDQLLEEIKSEAPEGKVPMIIQRNPSLLRGSANLTWISKIGKDPSDASIGFSSLVAKYSNADYDGDALNCYLIMDQQMLDLFEPFDLKYSATDMRRPYELSGFLTLLPAGNIICSNYLADREENTKEDKVVQMLRPLK